MYDCRTIYLSIYLSISLSIYVCIYIYIYIYIIGSASCMGVWAVLFRLQVEDPSRAAGFGIPEVRRVHKPQGRNEP